MNPGQRPFALSYTVSIAVVGLLAYAALGWWWGGLSLFIQPTEVLNKMAPLLLTAGFIERAVEVVVSPWRDAGAAQLARQLDVARAKAGATPEGIAAAANEIAAAADKVEQYKEQTQQYALAASITLSLAAAIVGVRALWPFLNMNVYYNYISATQRGAFLIVDVVLSAALLAGGADGIHSVVNSFTTFFDTTAQKSQNSVSVPQTPPAPQPPLVP